MGCDLNYDEMDNLFTVSVLQNLYSSAHQITIDVRNGFEIRSSNTKY